MMDEIIDVVKELEFSDVLVPYQDMLINALKEPIVDGDWVSVLVHSLNHPKINMAIFGVEVLA